MEGTLNDKRQKRLADFIAPFRVKPGAKVTLAKNFDPRFKAGIKNKKDGVALLEEGVRQQREALLEVKQALKAQAPEGAAPDPFEQEQEQQDRADVEPAQQGGGDGDG
jgi:hypothetical protein